MSCRGSNGADVPAGGLVKPASPPTASGSRPTMTGASTRNDEIAPVGEDQLNLALCDRRHLAPEACAGFPPAGQRPHRRGRAPAVGGRSVAFEVTSLRPIGIRARCRCRCRPSPASPSPRRHRRAARGMRPCRQGPAAEPDRTRPGTATNASPPRSPGRHRRAVAASTSPDRSSAGSKPVVGSSSTSSDGSVNSSIATETRLRWPPDSLSTRVSACSVISSSSSTREITCCRSV